MSWNPLPSPPTLLDLLIERVIEEGLLEEVLEKIVETLTGCLHRLKQAASLLCHRDGGRTAQCGGHTGQLDSIGLNLPVV